MANYFVSYDLNGAAPTHAAVDKHMNSSGWQVGRVLETVWYVGTSDTSDAIYNYMGRILSPNDGLLVIEATDVHFRKLLVDEDSLLEAWRENA